MIHARVHLIIAREANGTPKHAKIAESGEPVPDLDWFSNRCIHLQEIGEATIAWLRLRLREYCDIELNSWSRAPLFTRITYQNYIRNVSYPYRVSMIDGSKDEKIGNIVAYVLGRSNNFFLIESIVSSFESECRERRR
jgi:hypothetical protein